MFKIFMMLNFCDILSFIAHLTVTLPRKNSLIRWMFTTMI